MLGGVELVFDVGFLALCVGQWHKTAQSGSCKGFGDPAWAQQKQTCVAQQLVQRLPHNHVDVGHLNGRLIAIEREA